MICPNCGFPKNSLEADYCMKCGTRLERSFLEARGASSSQYTIETIAGDGKPGFKGDGGPARRCRLKFPFGLCFDPQGSLIVADTENHVVRSIDLSGVISTMAGHPLDKKPPASGTSATRTAIVSPIGLCFDREGNLYIAAFNGNQVFRVDHASGEISAFAGDGTFPPAQPNDGGPATKAQLNNPCGVAVDQHGRVFIADSGHHRIRMIGASGVISTFAGTGEAGYAGDGGPAAEAVINGPAHLLSDLFGNLLFTDQKNNRVRMVKAGSAIITTVAGNGEGGYGGDGGRAVDAVLNLPGGIAVDRDGGVIFSEFHRVRRVGPDGIVQTIAGTGEPGFSGDKGPAIKAKLNCPAALAVDQAGCIYIADSENHRVRKLTPV